MASPDHDHWIWMAEVARWLALDRASRPNLEGDQDSEGGCRHRSPDGGNAGCGDCELTEVLAPHRYASRPGSYISVSRTASSLRDRLIGVSPRWT